MWAWGWLPTVRFAASQWRQRIFIVARNIRSGSGPTANRGSILMCIYLVFRTFLYYVTMISSAQIIAFRLTHGIMSIAIPIWSNGCSAESKTRVVRAASSVETSHHCDLFWNILIQVPSLSFICCADHGSVDFHIFQCQQYRDWFVSTSFSLLQCVAIQGLVVCWQWSRRQHRLIDSSTRHHSSATNWILWFDSIRGQGICDSSSAPSSPECHSFAGGDIAML